ASDNGARLSSFQWNGRQSRHLLKPEGQQMNIKHGATALAIVLFAALGLAGGPARAEVNEVTIADQFGIAYLPLMVMRDKKLLEKHALAAGLPAIKVKWAQFGGGTTVNDALLSGSIAFAVAGPPSLVLLWEKTKGTPLEIKGLGAVNNT